MHKRTKFLMENDKNIYPDETIYILTERAGYTRNDDNDLIDNENMIVSWDNITDHLDNYVTNDDYFQDHLEVWSLEWDYIKFIEKQIPETIPNKGAVELLEKWKRKNNNEIRITKT